MTKHTESPHSCKNEQCLSRVSPILCAGGGVQKLLLPNVTHCLQPTASDFEPCCSSKVQLRCVFSWLPGERETTEDDRPTHHFLSLRVLVFCFSSWGTHSIKPFSQVTVKTSNYFTEKWLRFALLKGQREFVMLMKHFFYFQQKMNVYSNYKTEK